MVRIPSNKDGNYLIIKVSTNNNFHKIMTQMFIDSLINKLGKKNIRIRSLDLDCLPENMLKNPLRFLKSIIRLLNRSFLNIYQYKIKRNKLFYSFNPFVLKYEDIKEIKKLIFLNEIDDIYSFLGIQLGDLINDTFLRFSWGDKYFLKGISKFFLITYTFIIFRQTNSFLHSIKNNKCLFLSAQGSYINNGIPFRIFNRNNNITCYSSSSNNHTWLDFVGNNCKYPFIDYLRRGKDLQEGLLYNLDKALKIGEQGLLKRTSGSNDLTMPYMRISSFDGERLNQQINLNDASIIYLHDLIDVSHQYEGFIFKDMIEYIKFTINVLLENNKKLFIKLHPNETKDSKKIRNVIFNELNIPQKLILKSNFSNKIILSSKIKNVISAHGNIIIEAGFYGHFSIGATKGSPASSFRNLLKTPFNKEDYKNLLLRDFKNIDKKLIIKESKLAYFLLFNADYYMNDIDLEFVRKLKRDTYNNKEYEGTLPHLNLELI